MYAIKSPETKKRYPDRFKAFLDYIQIPGKNIEERLVNFYNKAKQNLPWLQNSLMNFIIFQKERVLNGEIAAFTISNYYKPINLLHYIFVKFYTKISLPKPHLFSVEKKYSKYVFYLVDLCYLVLNKYTTVSRNSH